MDEHAPAPNLSDAIADRDVDGVLRALRLGADPNRVEDECGWSPFYLAVRIGDFRVIRLLIEHGATVHADDGGVKPHDRSTSLHYPAEEGRVDLLRLLLSEAGGAAVLGVFDYIARTPLICAVE